MNYLKYLLFSAVLIYIVSCKKDNPAPVVVDPPIDDTIPNDTTPNDTTPNDTTPIITIPIIVDSGYVAPTNGDNYISIASWGYRSSWNLANVHDPTVAKCGDYYYMYQTDASYGNAHSGHGFYPYRRSKDLVKWEFLGMTFSSIPAWVKDSLNNKRSRIGLNPIANPSYGCWAPCIRKVGNIYRLYYCVVVTNCITGTNTDYSWTERAFIGLAESSDLSTNVWEDKGMVVCSEPDGKEAYTRTGSSDWSAYFKFNAIDPSFIVTPEGEHWLIYGSWHTGIAALKLNPETGKPDKLETINDYGIRIAGRGNVTTNRWQALEAPEIIYNENTGYYYLFLAYDGLDIPYNTRVARSTSITGPYLTINGANVTTGAECYPILTHPYKFSKGYGWVGISHCCLFKNDETGQWYYASQGRFPANISGINASNAIMMGHVREISWTEDGWPVVMPERYAAVPQKTYPAEYLVGAWEMVTLKYVYKVQQKPINIYLQADYTITGDMSGTWSYDEVTSTMTLGNNKVIVRRGLDWEETPRKTTFIFAGLNNIGQSLWGKRIEDYN